MNATVKMTFSKRVTDFIRTYCILFYASGIHLFFLIANPVILSINPYLLSIPCFLVQGGLGYKFYDHFGALFAVLPLKTDFYIPDWILRFITVYGFFVNSLIFSLCLPSIAECMLPGSQSLTVFYFSLLMFNIFVYAIFGHLRYVSLQTPSFREAAL